MGTSFLSLFLIYHKQILIIPGQEEAASAYDPLESASFVGVNDFESFILHYGAITGLLLEWRPRNALHATVDDLVNCHCHQYWGTRLLASPFLVWYWWCALRNWISQTKCLINSLLTCTIIQQMGSWRTKLCQQIHYMPVISHKLNYHPFFSLLCSYTVFSEVLYMIISVYQMSLEQFMNAVWLLEPNQLHKSK